MTEKHRRRREEILDIATEVWGTLSPERRSLSILAQACGITKQGFYRYFSGKQAIVEELNNRFRNQVRRDNEKLLALASSSPMNWPEVIDLAFSNIVANWKQILLYLEEGFDEDQGNIIHDKEFYTELENRSQVPSRLWLWIFSTLTAIIWNKVKNTEIHSIHYRCKVQDTLLQGFANGELSEEMFNKIEARSGTTSVDRGEHNRIADAVLRLIRAKGHVGITLQEVADYAGMGKSSLYNYFDSKDDLFLSLICDIQEQFRSGFRLFVRGYEDPMELLYAYVLYLIKFLDSYPAIQILITDLKNGKLIQGAPKFRKQSYPETLELFEFAVEQGVLRDDVLSAEGLKKAMDFSIGVFFLTEDSSPVEKRARKIFRLFAGGVNEVLQINQPENDRQKTEVL